MTHLLHHFISQGYSIALWRLPNSETLHWIADLQIPLQTQKPIIEQEAVGFWISPFWNEHLENTYFIRAEWHAVCNNQVWHLPTNTTMDTDRQASANIQQYFLPTPAITYTTQNEHEALVQAGIEAIEKGEMRKLVLSRAKSIAYPAGFDIFTTFEKLCATYPTAFCYFFHLPAVGTWMGATPETLIAIEENQTVFRTVALAGTQAYKGQAVRNALWSQKEIEEQAIVSRYIINCFKKIRLREFEEDGPKTVIAGHLMHLQTNFWVNMQGQGEEEYFPQLGSKMLELLHPTSAVCGMPKPESQAFILAHEGYDRQFYSGFLGTSNVEHNSHLFVNLRCMQLHEASLTLYAGGGITIDSVPEHEWEETALKMQIMQRVI